MGLPMTIDEIQRDYREAADKKDQIKILAEQNLVTPYEMLVILKNYGEDVDMRWYLSPEQRRARRREAKATAAEGAEPSTAASWKSALFQVPPDPGPEVNDPRTDPEQLMRLLRQRLEELELRNREMCEEIERIAKAQEKLMEERDRLTEAVKILTPVWG